MAQVIAMIPARLQSSRLPEKLLLSETGKPLLQHTWEAASRAGCFERVIVATDSERIAEAVREFGGEVEMTGEHASGTDRIAEVARRLDLPTDAVVVNVQGDEPELDPSQLDLLVETLRSRPDAQMATLATPIESAEDRDSPSCVKVVMTQDGTALYFSRAMIPFVRDEEPDELLKANSPWKLHIGVYAYRADFLLKLADASPSPLEQLEKLEQLRALELGGRIVVAEVRHPAIGIDTAEDYARFARRVRYQREGEGE
ncbi:3-deoxy-manno-octulosonate cytidylyltransferase [Stratiformator vulcanicus]|uniref:3-deoxy-manno-octulosonate cytidylyltransferase n=1 Tax=Stratiformator vulcanicus TaxID=2527980 RepID=A0A517R156_9PLAN|nr:3-deoxy-manno-octulosonate cytidylyltransferase [Stratiformator vulcanicus]QDT37627.1 3-deoxy-manno-octulosonate cytidylyltransferase [Stratiformator vulcanicus]